MDSVLTIVLAALPGLAVAAWALFKGYAASSAAKWDDEAVAFVEKLAAGVVAKAGTPVATPVGTPLTGTDH